MFTYHLLEQNSSVGPIVILKSFFLLHANDTNILFPYFLFLQSNNIMSDINNNAYLGHLCGEDEYINRQSEIMSQVASAISSIGCMAMLGECNADGNASNYSGRSPGSQTRKRKRKDIEEYILLMDDALFRRKYRMNKPSFYKLLDIVGDHMPSHGPQQRQGTVPNGVITKVSRLSMALRYAAGGDPLDISDLHGVGSTEVLTSFWYVIDAIHASPEMDIKFPESHEEQVDIMQGFQNKSAIDINSCVGAIDGILIWTHRPSTKDIKVLKFGSTKFFCGRKMKYGLNMMAVCDSKRRFLWVEARFPGAASDYYAFDDSHLKKMLEKKGFLRPGLCLFGDNAYVNSPYMCTPWRGVSGGPKDAFNFFHSQLRINIECAFGILVHRWGMLRKPIAMNISVKKTTSLVYALCKLHNYCIESGDEQVDRPSESDILNITTEGGLYLPRMDGSGDAHWEYDMNVDSRDRLSDLLDGGQHTDDHTKHSRRRYRFETDLPCKRMLEHVAKNGFRRPELSRLRLGKN